MDMNDVLEALRTSAPLLAPFAHAFAKRYLLTLPQGAPRDDCSPPTVVAGQLRGSWSGFWSRRLSASGADVELEFGDQEQRHAGSARYEDRTLELVTAFCGRWSAIVVYCNLDRDDHWGAARLWLSKDQQTLSGPYAGCAPRSRPVFGKIEVQRRLPAPLRWAV